MIPAINLLPWRATLRENRVKSFVGRLLAAVLLPVLVSALWSLLLFTDLVNTHQRVSLLQERVDLLASEMLEHRQTREHLLKTSNRLQRVDRLKNHGKQIAQTLDLLTRSMPDRLAYTSLSLSQSAMTVQGVTHDSEPVRELLRQLNSAGRFGEIVLERIHESKSRGQFNFTIRLNSQPEVTHEGQNKEDV